MGFTQYFTGEVEWLYPNFTLITTTNNKARIHGMLFYGKPMI